MTTKKTTKTKTRIIAAALAVISTVSLTAFAATSASAAETGKTAATAQLSDEEQKKKDFEELKKAKDGKEAMAIYQKIYDRMERKMNEPKPDPIDHKGKTTVKTDGGEKDYDTFDEAFEQAVKAKKAFIKLHSEQNQLTGKTVPAGCDIDIDINGFSMYSKGDTFTVDNGGVLHISNGFFSGGCSAVKANGTVYLNKLTIRDATDSAVKVAQGVKAIITNCLFEENKGERGGAIYVPEDTDQKITYSNFYRNTANGSGGGIYVGEHSKLEAIALTLTANEANYRGGAIYLGALTKSDHYFDAMKITDNKASIGGGVYCDAGFARAADVYLNRDIIVKDNANGNFYLVKDYGKKAVLYTTRNFFTDQSCVYVNSSESGERAVVSLEEKFHENAFHGDNGRRLERGTLHNYTLYIQ